MAQIDLKNVLLYLKDGTTPTANQVEIKVGEGTLTYTESREMEYTLNRGLLDTVREGDEVPMDVSFDLIWEELRSTTSSSVTVEDALKFTGGAASWVSTSADACEPKALDIELHHDPACTTQQLEVITLSDFRWESIDHDVADGTLSVTGRCNAKVATIVRSAQT